MEVDELPDWASKYGVNGYPTVKFFPAAKKNDTLEIPESEKEGKLFKGNYPIADYKGERVCYLF
jgi:hypothetical protein